MMKILILLIFIVSCSHLKKQNFKNSFKAGEYLVSGCRILNTDGTLKKSFPGGQCLFLPDGSLISYDYAKIELTYFRKDMSVLWRKKIHVHHESLQITKSGELAFLSSFVARYNGIQKVRFDEIVKASLETGDVTGRFSMEEHARALNPHAPFFLYPTDWEKVLGHTHEATHAGWLHELKSPLYKNGQILFPAGSFIVMVNGFEPRMHVISSDLKTLLGTRRLTSNVFAHTVIPYSDHELIYFVNTHFFRPISQTEEAHIAVYDFNKEQVSQTYHGDFFAFYSGGVQVLNRDLLLVSDLGSKFSEKISSITGDDRPSSKIREHKKTKARALLYSSQGKVLDELHFDFANQSFVMMDLSDFLRNNIGI